MAKAFNIFALTFGEALKVARLAVPTTPTGAVEAEARAGPLLEGGGSSRRARRLCPGAGHSWRARPLSAETSRHRRGLEAWRARALPLRGEGLLSYALTCREGQGVQVLQFLAREALPGTTSCPSICNMI